MRHRCSRWKSRISLAGRWRDLSPAMWILSILFVIKLGWFAG